MDQLSRVLLDENRTGQTGSDLRRQKNSEPFGYTCSDRDKVDRTLDLAQKTCKRVEYLEAKVKSLTEITPTTSRPEPKLEEVFRALAKNWKEDTINLSSMERITANDAYLSIIGLGHDAVPLILEALANAPDWWFCALRAITRTDPATEDMRGDLIATANAWLNWGRKYGYL